MAHKCKHCGVDVVSFSFTNGNVWYHYNPDRLENQFYKFCGDTLNTAEPREA